MPDMRVTLLQKQKGSYGIIVLKVRRRQKNLKINLKLRQNKLQRKGYV